MWLPLNDPFVIFGLVASGLIVIVLIVLLAVVQRRSANDVWKLVRREKKDLEHGMPSQKDNDTDTLMTDISVEARDYAPVEPEPEVPSRPTSPVETVAPKIVRFSLPVERTSVDITTEHHSPKAEEPLRADLPVTAETFDEIFDRWHSSGVEDVPFRSTNRRSRNEQQVSEFHFQHV